MLHFSHCTAVCAICVMLVHVTIEWGPAIVMLPISLPDSKVHGANMGPIWVLSAPDGPHVGPMNFAIWVGLVQSCDNMDNLFQNTHNRQPIGYCEVRCGWLLWAQCSTLALFFNPSHAETKKNVYLNFLSVLETEMVQLAEILHSVRQGPIYTSYSMPWLLMAWRCKKPGHQQPTDLIIPTILPFQHQRV